MIQAMALDVLQPSADLMTDVLPASAYPKLISLANDSLNVLMVEDVYSDAMIIKIALDATKIPFELSKIRRGDAVLPHLSISRIISELLAGNGWLRSARGNGRITRLYPSYTNCHSNCAQAF